MKLIIVIISDSDRESVQTGLIEKDFRVTLVASTGGFFRRGNTTLLIGVEDDAVDEALDIIRRNTEEPEDPAQRRATVFVLDVAQHMQL
jgi:uncharacterized protein YaaQ